MVANHFVYFIKAKRYPWVKIGMSRDLLSLQKRIDVICGREPFECEVKGVSSLMTEPEFHTALAVHRIRSEWFRWNQHVSDFVKAKCNVYHRHKDGDDGFWLLVNGFHAAQQRTKSLEIAAMLQQSETGP